MKEIFITGHGGHMCEAWCDNDYDVGANIDEAIGLLILKDPEKYKFNMYYMSEEWCPKVSVKAIGYLISLNPEKFGFKIKIDNEITTSAYDRSWQIDKKGNIMNEEVFTVPVEPSMEYIEHWAKTRSASHPEEDKINHAKLFKDYVLTHEANQKKKRIYKLQELLSELKREEFQNDGSFQEMCKLAKKAESINVDGRLIEKIKENVGINIKAPELTTFSILGHKEDCKCTYCEVASENCEVEGFYDDDGIRKTPWDTKKQDGRVCGRQEEYSEDKECIKAMKYESFDSVVRKIIVVYVGVPISTEGVNSISAEVYIDYVKICMKDLESSIGTNEKIVYIPRHGGVTSIEVINL